MDHGKYLHEVLEEATAEDLASYMALRNIEAREERNARRREEARSKGKTLR